MLDHLRAKPPEISAQTRRGISWSLIGALVTNGTRIVVLAVLGRTLTSTDFGIVAAAVSVNVIIYGLRDFGIGLAIVQRKELEPDHISTAFAVSTYLGLLLSLGLYFAAPTIARLYGIPEAVDVIRVLALIFFGLRGVATISRVLCQRAMNFRLISIIDSLSFTTGSVVSILCALAGLGPWALIAGYLVEELLSTGLFLWFSPPRASLQVHWTRLRELLHFGIGQTVMQSANVVATNGDNFIVGNALGAASLGFYARAYDLIKFPSMVFDAVVGNVLFPAFARQQNDRTNLATSFRRVLLVNGLILLPASVAIIVVAPDAIRVLMGTGWAEMILPFRILALTILLRTNLKLGGILAQAAGAMHAVAGAYIVYMLVIVGGAMLTIRWGLTGVAVSTAVGIAVVSLHCCYLAMRVSGLPIKQFGAAHVPGLFLAVVVAAVSWPLRSALLKAAMPAGMVLALVSGISFALALAIAFVFLKRGHGDFGWLAEQLRRKTSGDEP